MKRYKEMEKEAYSSMTDIKSRYNRAHDYYRSIFKNDYPEQTLTGCQKCLYTNEKLTINKRVYIFYTFDTWDIGESVALSSDDYLVIEGVRFNHSIFRNCNVRNIIFRRCSFAGSKFEKVHFDHVIFEECMCSEPVLEQGGDAVNETYYMPSVFMGCIFIANFMNCDLGNSIIEKTNFTLSNFKNTSLQNTIINCCALSGVVIRDCNLRDMAIINTDILNVTFDDKQHSTVSEKTFIDYKIKTKKRDIDKKNSSGWIAGSYDGLYLDKSMSIRGFSDLFYQNGYPDVSGELFYRAKILERTCVHGYEKVKSWIGFLLCGYGERPSFTFWVIVLSTLLFALLYMFAGVDAAGNYIKYSFGGSTPFVQVISDYWKCVFFSITTFSTVGYGNYVPAESASMLLAAVHMFIGISLCALWTGCIFRKIAR